MSLPFAIDSNQTNLALAEETSLKVLPGSPVWYQQEPNSYPTTGADYKSIARTPITNTRMKRKGTTVDVDVKAGFNSDVTQRNLMRLLQGFFWADALEKPASMPLNGTQVTLTGVTTTQFQAASGLAIFSSGGLGLARNMTNAANNGLFHITAVAAGAVTTDKTLIAETPPANANIQQIGYQFTTGDLTLTAASGIVTLATTTKDLTTLGLNVGEWIYLGGDGSFGFANAANTGYGRIASIATNAIVLDIVNFSAVTDAGTGKAVRIFFGKVIRNAVVATSIKRRSYTIERQLGNDGVGIQAEYLLGCIPDQFTLNVQEAAKLTADLTFVGMDILNQDGTIGIMAGSRPLALGEDAFNTSHDIVSSRLYVVDPTTFNPTPLFAYASDLKLIINNGVKPNKAIGVFGAFEASASYFDATGTATAYFQSVDAVSAIRKSGNVAYNMIAAHENEGIVFDIPLLSLGGGENKVEQDKSIMVDLTISGGECPNGYVALITFFEYLPTVAMPS